MVNFQKPFFTDPTISYPDKDHEIGMPSGTRVQSQSDKDLMDKRSKLAPIRTMGDIIKALALLGIDSNGDHVRVFASGGIGPAGATGSDGAGFILASDFGIVADSTQEVSGTDNASAIKDLIQHIAANPGHTVLWPQDFSKAIGFTGILQFSHADQSHIFGSPLLNIGDYNLGGPTVLFGSSIFINHLAGINTELGRIAPYPIATVLAGEDTIVLSTPAQANDFEVGSSVLVCGYDQQGGGFPANLRYKEFRTVLSSNSMTGEVKLDKPLSYSYYDTWYFYTGGSDIIGPAGIVPLNRGTSASFIKNIEVINLTVLDNLSETPNTLDGEYIYNSSLIGMYGFKYGHFVNLKTSSLFSGEHESLILDNPTIVDYEPDKLANHLQINGGLLTRIIQGTGYDQIECNGTTFKYQVSLRCKNYQLNDCTFLGNGTGVDKPLSFDSSLYQQNQSIQNNIFEFNHPEPIFLGESPTEDGGHPYVPGTKNLTVSGDLSPTSNYFTTSFGSGSGLGRIRLEAGIGTRLTRPSDGAKFIISNIEYVGDGDVDVDGYFKITFDSAYTPIEGDILYYYSSRLLRFAGNTRLGRYKNLPWLGGQSNGKRISDVYECPEDGISAHTIRLHLRDIPTGSTTNNYFEVDGYLREIEVNVITPYTGVTADKRLIVSLATPYGATYNFTIATQVAGQRIIRPEGSLNAQSGDTLTSLPYGTYCGLVNIRTSAVDNPGALGWDGYIDITATRR